MFLLFWALPLGLTVVSLPLFSSLLSHPYLPFFRLCYSNPHHQNASLCCCHVSSNHPPTLRCIRANDRVCKPGEPPVPADLGCGQAAGLYSRHRSCLLDHPHGLQHLVVQTPQEKEWPLQQLCRHTQRSVHKSKSRPWTQLECLISSFLCYRGNAAQDFLVRCRVYLCCTPVSPILFIPNAVK